MDIHEELDKIKIQIKEKNEMQAELEREMEELELKSILVRAELIGLEQRRKAVAEAVAAARPASRASKLSQVPAVSDVKKLTLVDAVVEVINESAEPMRIEDVRRRLGELGRDDGAASVAPTLHYAAMNEKIRRVARGVYGPLP